MTDERFWTLADKYEKNGKILNKDIKTLCEDILEENNFDYDESLADLSLFNFKDLGKAEEIFDGVWNKHEEDNIKRLKYLLNKENCCSLDKSEMFELQDLINAYGYPSY